MILHWAEQLAAKITERYQPPYIISGGMTTSGPTHFGTVCEFLFPGTIAKVIEREGKQVKFLFVADIMDAFDKVPIPMEKYNEFLEPHLGKPLCFVPDPTGKSKSFGEHYLDEAIEIMKEFELNIEVIKANEMIENGMYDGDARFFLQNEKVAKKIVAKTSLRTIDGYWSSIMPLCQKCGKIATTRTLSYNKETDEYEYSCDRDIGYTKGCGFCGKNKISDHKYKILWRLDWPARTRFLKTNLEGGGIDHHTRGGSYDTLVGIFREMFKEDPPIGYTWGMLLFEGKKYSKSKGIGMGIVELKELIPMRMIAYMLIKPDLTENIDIVPTKENLLKLYDEFERIGKLSDGIKTNEELEKVERPEQKKVQAYRLCPNKTEWNAPFSDVLLTYMIYRDFEKVKEILKDGKGIEYLKPYIKKWVEKDFVPEQYKFSYAGRKTEDEDIKKILNDLEDNMGKDEIQNTIFEYSKRNDISPKEIFQKMYLALIGKERGPKLGNLIYTLGVAKIKKDFLG
ncbi:MAG: lysine--tRNA ligase [Candidatus Micrarchaeia archaeon]